MHLIIATSLSPASRSALLARRLAGALRSRAIEHELLDLRDLPLPACDGDRCYDDPNVVRLTGSIRDAATVTIASPVYNYGTGPSAANLLAVTGSALKDKVVGLMGASGGPRSYMALLGLANSLMLDFRVIVIPRFVFASADAFGDGEVADPDVLRRIEELARELDRLGGLLAPDAPLESPA